MNKSTKTRLENKYNIGITVIDKLSGYYSYALEIRDYNKKDRWFQTMITSKEPIYKQIERKLNK